MSSLNKRFFACFLVLLSIAASQFGFAGQQTKKGTAKPAPKPAAPAQPKKPAEDGTLAAPPADSLERIRARPTQQERISALERFIAAQKGASLEGQARE